MDDGSLYRMIFNLILFGSVLLFIGVYCYNFYKGYKSAGEEEEQEKEEIVRKIDRNSMKSRKLMEKGNLCKTCGCPNDIDAKFCKSCGEKLK